MTTITVDDIKWGAYGGFEGPYFKGAHQYTIPEFPDMSDKFLAVIASTEGANYSAINMYDRMIVSVGIIQWAEAGQFSVSNMLGTVAEALGIDYVLKCLAPALTLSNASFVKNKKEQWRFVFNDRRGEVNTTEKQRDLFLNGKGEMGTWDAVSKLRAKTWAACIANVWNDPKARQAQNNYTKKRLMCFVVASAHDILFSDVTTNMSVGWPGAVRAAYLSFAANLPAVAADNLNEAIKTAMTTKWSEDWSIHVIKQLTFGPKIKIYPHRYECIRPVIESLFGVVLPTKADDLQRWQPKRERDTIKEIEIKYVPDPGPSQDELEKPTEALVVPKNFWNVIIDFLSRLISLFIKGGK